MGMFSDLINSALGNSSDEYKEAVARRQQTGRLTTGGTGYSDRQTRALQFAQDVARGWSAQSLGEAMGRGQVGGALGVNAAMTAMNAVTGNNNYDSLNSLDEAQKRSEGLQVAEANEKQKEQYDNAANLMEGVAGGIQQGVQLGMGGTEASKASGKQWDKTKQGIKDAWSNYQARKSAKQPKEDLAFNSTAKFNQYLD